MECIHYGGKKRHVFNQEENQPDPQCFLACHMLPSCMSPSVTRHKKLKNPFLLPACAMKIGSLFLRTGKKHQHSHTELVICTLFGKKTEQGHLHLVIQMEPTSPPLVVLELASSTDFFMKTIAKEPLHFFLTCVKKYTSMSIWEEWKWTEHANGRSIGDALRLISEATNLEFLEVIKHVTCGTGVIPDCEDRGVKGGMFYMRAKFERMKLSFDAESLSMVRSDSTGCADISICFSRV
ncbi:protein MIZU-KUSSEI 1-like protein [Carex littledalei]|uniref:Protein MIZU-KUSSEI 1-like protein n=1 Tax=Carex littledalei TaxID=544730 RepID=A0A833QED2_9POAL|nr:protein MIZU-KUSSEI 1-like protein [Carex littledalei]